MRQWEWLCVGIVVFRFSRSVWYLRAWNASSVAPLLLSVVISLLMQLSSSWSNLLLNSTTCVLHDSKEIVLFPEQSYKNLVCEEASSGGEAPLDWHIQMNEQSIERSGYIFLTSLLRTSVISIMNTAASPDRPSSHSDIHRGKWWY